MLAWDISLRLNLSISVIKHLKFPAHGGKTEISCWPYATIATGCCLSSPASPPDLPVWLCLSEGLLNTFPILETLCFLLAYFLWLSRWIFISGPEGSLSFCPFFWDHPISWGQILVSICKYISGPRPSVFAAESFTVALGLTEKQCYPAFALMPGCLHSNPRHLLIKSTTTRKLPNCSLPHFPHL